MAPSNSADLILVPFKALQLQGSLYIPDNHTGVPGTWTTPVRQLEAKLTLQTAVWQSPLPAKLCNCLAGQARVYSQQELAQGYWEAATGVAE